MGKEETLIRVEYFDDRFYKVTVPKDDKRLATAPEHWITRHEEEADIYCPSVTTVIGHSKPNDFLVRWRGDVGNREADRRMSEAAEKGSIIHDCCQKFCEGWTIVYQNPHTQFPPNAIIDQLKKQYDDKVYVTSRQDIQIQVARFERLLDILQPEILGIEHNLYYIGDICYGGTIDYIWKLKGGEYSITKKTPEVIEGGVYVVDLKSGNAAGDFNFIQTAPYMKAYTAETGTKLKGSIILHTNSSNKTGIEGVKLYIKTGQELKPYYEQFTNYYKVFVSDYRELKPVIFDIPAIISGRKNLNIKEAV